MPFEELVAIADALVVAAPGDTSTTAISWAMAAGTAVIGSAVHAVAELIANKLNGLLFKIEKGETVAMPVARLLQNRDGQRKVKETARGQAYEVFGLRRFAEQHDRLYENLLTGRAPGEGITDPALVA
jgi:glycosyltransferase involved in cell wall biosynthesis